MLNLTYHFSNGIQIGNRAVIGMGAIVAKDVPPETVVVGCPAEYYCSREEYDQKQLEWSQAYDNNQQ